MTRLTCAVNALRAAEPQLWPACMKGCEEASSRRDDAGGSPGEAERGSSRRSAVGCPVLQTPWVRMPEQSART
jgi:hypothetical protein